VAFVSLAVVGIFLVCVPPFNQSITSALNRNDSSVIGHIEAIGRDLQAVVENIFGLGLSSADRVVMISAVPTPAPTPTASPKPNQSGGPTASSAPAAQAIAPVVDDNSDLESAGIGEDLYLSVLVSTGPLGGATFFAWCLGVTVALFRGARRTPRNWLVIGTATALVGSLVSAITSSALMRFTTAASSWLLLGLATGLVLSTSPGVAGFTRENLRALHGPLWRLGKTPRSASSAHPR
jgi:hypothetical protein